GGNHELDLGRKSEVEQENLPLDLGAVSDTVDLKLLGKPVGNPDDHVMDQLAVESVKTPTFLRVLFPGYHHLIGGNGNFHFRTVILNQFPFRSLNRNHAVN